MLDADNILILSITQCDSGRKTSLNIDFEKVYENITEYYLTEVERQIPSHNFGEQWIRKILSVKSPQLKHFH